MEHFTYNLSGWLTTSGTHLSGIAPSGTLCWRTVNLNLSGTYETGHVSTCGGSFKKVGESGNWYGDSAQTRDAEAPASGRSVYEVWKVSQDTSVLDVYCTPAQYLSGIATDGTLNKPDCYARSWLLLDLLATTHSSFRCSGVRFPSRRIGGAVFIFNPKMVPMELLYTSMHPPSGMVWN